MVPIQMMGKWFEMEVVTTGDPLRGRLIAVDTETELIKNEWDPPPLVLLQVCDGERAHVVPWQYAASYMERLLAANEPNTLVFHNLSFDIPVLTRLREESRPLNKLVIDPLLRKLGEGLIHDTGLMYQLSQIAGTDPAAENYPSLKFLVKKLLHVDLDKDEGVRLGFSRDKPLSADDLEYAGLDAVATWLCADKLLPTACPTSSIQSRAMYSLDKISREGMLVRTEALDALRVTVVDRMESARADLKVFGVHLDGKSVPSTGKAALEEVAEALGHDPSLMPKPTSAKAMAFALRDVLSGGTGLGLDPGKTPMEGVAADIFKLLGTGPEPDGDGVYQPLKAKQAAFLWWNHALHGGVAGAAEAWDVNAGWTEDREGPDQAVQRVLAGVEEELGISFTRTETGKICTDENAMAMLPEDGHPFLSAFKGYKGAEKLLSSYLSDKHVKSDGRVHPWFSVILRTGRTSCASPALQTIPKFPGVREVYGCPDGHVLLNADYSQLELCALGEHCYKTQGASRMRDVINTGLDLHAWVGMRLLGRHGGLPDVDPGKLDTVAAWEDAIRKVKGEMPEEFDSARNRAKAANFGA